jgi:hypothetical protein
MVPKFAGLVTNLKSIVCVYISATLDRFVNMHPAKFAFKNVEPPTMVFIPIVVEVLND